MSLYQCDTKQWYRIVVLIEDMQKEILYESNLVLMIDLVDDNDLNNSHREDVTKTHRSFLFLPFYDSPRQSRTCLLHIKRLNA
jgi:hypothetical protein